MIIVANGAQKSGSTWQTHIALQIRPAAEPPERYRKPKRNTPRNYSIHANLIETFLADPQVRAQDTLFKLHLGDPQIRDRLLADPLVRVLNIARDPRDVIVSYYHHHNKYSGKKFQSFAEYYPQYGRNHLWRVLTHHRVWQVTSPRYLCINYEDLKRDQPGNIRRMAALLEVDVSDERVAEIIAATSPETISRQFKPGPMNQFRKGTGGEWVDLLQPEHLDDIAALERAITTPLIGMALHGPPPFRRLLRRFTRLPRALPALRRTVQP